MEYSSFDSMQDINVIFNCNGIIFHICLKLTMY
ncbi:Uncharacterised protein [Enterobacter hormaechei]|nr:Uncharacterised protein [Enterobacter hormaechei]